MRRLGWLLLMCVLWSCGRGPEDQLPDGRLEMTTVPPGMARLAPRDTVVMIYITDVGKTWRDIAQLLGWKPGGIEGVIADLALGNSPLSTRREQPWAIALAPLANPQLGLALMPVVIVPTDALSLLDLGRMPKEYLSIRRDREGEYAAISPSIGPPAGRQAPTIARRVPTGDIGIRIDGPGMRKTLADRPSPGARVGEAVAAQLGAQLPDIVRTVLLPLAQAAAEGKEMRLRMQLQDGHAQIDAEVLGVPETAADVRRLAETASWLPRRAALHAAVAGEARLGRRLLGELLKALRRRVFERGTDAEGLIRLERAAEAVAESATRLAVAADGLPLGGMTQPRSVVRPSIMVAAWHGDADTAQGTWNRLYATLGGALDGDPNAPIESRSGEGPGALAFHAERGPPLRVSLDRAAYDALPGATPPVLLDLLEEAGAGAQTVLSVRLRRLARQLAARAAGSRFAEDLGRGVDDVNTLWVARGTRRLDVRLVLDLQAWVDLLGPGG